MTFNQLVSRNMFGVRVLMPFEVYLNLRRVYFGTDYLARPRDYYMDEDESEERYQLKSLLNVVADSGVVETYLITKHEMQYLPDSELKIIFDWISQQKEPDRPSTEESIIKRNQEMIAWEDKKINTTNALYKHQQIEKDHRLGNK